MNKAEMISSISKKTGLDRKVTDSTITGLLETIEEALGNGDKVQILGFGTFEVRKRSAHQGSHPKTGKEIFIAESSSPAFKPGSKLKEAITS